MATQDWSDDIVLADLVDDPELSDDLTILAERMEKEPKDVVLNFAAVNFLNSSNISRLLKLRKILIDQNKQLQLCSISIQVWGVFLLTGLDTLFDVVTDTAAALTSLQIK